MAAVNVQNRVARANSLLPAEVTRAGVITAKRQNSMLMVFSLYSEMSEFDETFLQTSNQPFAADSTCYVPVLERPQFLELKTTLFVSG